MKEIVVMKFGGTSVATPENRAQAIAHVKQELAAGKAPVVVVSAMGRMGAPYATDTLLSQLPRDAGTDTRDLMSSCGEIISACVFTEELRAAGVAAEAFTGESAGIFTTETHSSADIIGMNPANVFEAMHAGRVPVITGFQGRTRTGRTTTIGRGGSDTSAVVIGGYLGAQTVDIYTDVDGVAKADPRLIPQAAFMTQISSEAMLCLAQWGASVIHPKAVQAGLRFAVPMLRVRSTFTAHTGTEIIPHFDGSGFMGLAVLKNMQEQENGQYSVCGKQYDKQEGGAFAILTALYPGVQDAVRRQSEAEFPQLQWNGELAQLVLPMTELERGARRLYEILQQ